MDVNTYVLEILIRDRLAEMRAGGTGQSRQGGETALAAAEVRLDGDRFEEGD